MVGLACRKYPLHLSDLQFLPGYESFPGMPAPRPLEGEPLPRARPCADIPSHSLLFPFCLWPHPSVAFGFLNLGVSQGVAVPSPCSRPCLADLRPGFLPFQPLWGRPRGASDLSWHFAREWDRLPSVGEGVTLVCREASMVYLFLASPRAGILKGEVVKREEGWLSFPGGFSRLRF